MSAFALGLLVGLAATATPSCSGGGTGSSGGGGGLLPNGTPCTSNGDCLSDICAKDSQSGLQFCTTFCHTQSDCGSSFPNGCCYPSQPGSGFCAVAALCLNHGDGGLGDPCPQHHECSPDLVCVYSSDNTVSECTRPCDELHGCNNIPSECCEPVGTTYNYCIIDNACATSSGSTGTSGTRGTTGSSSSGGTSTTSVDAGPVTAYFAVGGTLTASTHGVLGTVAQSGDTVDIPPLSRDIQFDFPSNFSAGTYHCDTTTPSPDAGALQADVNTSAMNSPTFSGLLPLLWQGLIFSDQCGANRVGGAPDAIITSVDIVITDFAPGHLAEGDAGAIGGHVAGTAHWVLSRQGQQLDVYATIDTDLLPP